MRYCRYIELLVIDSLALFCKILLYSAIELPEDLDQSNTVRECHVRSRMNTTAWHDPDYCDFELFDHAVHDPRMCCLIMLTITKEMDIRASTELIFMVGSWCASRLAHFVLKASSRMRHYMIGTIQMQCVLSSCP